MFFIKGNLLDKNSGKKIVSYGITSKEMNKFKVNEIAILKDQSKIEIKENGEYLWKSEKSFEHKRGKRIFITALSPPKFTLDNYKEVLFKEGVGQAFLNTLTVAIPSTIIPLIICSFFAYALSWMKFWGRDTLFAIIVANKSLSLNELTNRPTVGIIHTITKVISNKLVIIEVKTFFFIMFFLPLCVYEYSKSLLVLHQPL